jgi:hypothetical protein
MHFHNPLSASPSPIFPTYLLPSLPFRRRKSSTNSTGTVSSNKSAQEDDDQASAPSYLAHSASLLRCAHCLADLCPTASIISKGFTGRHGRAYLVAPPPRTADSSHLAVRHPRELGNLPNTSLDRAVPRQLVTGQHTVADIRCRLCDAVLGWKYVAAEEEAQRYKVGKFILETRKVVRGVDWERVEPLGCYDGDEDAYNNGGAVLRSTTGAAKGKAFDPGNDADGDDIEFDSQDEDECEDLFTGVWSPALAKKRREKKFEWRRDADVDMV